MIFDFNKDYILEDERVILMPLEVKHFDNFLDFSEKELIFYNMFFAFLSLIIGQSYFLKIIIDTNKKFREKKIQFKRKKITHDQNVLIWFFLSWFLRFATMYGFLNMVGFGQNVNYAPAFYENFSFYEEYSGIIFNEYSSRLYTICIRLFKTFKHFDLRCSV